jgi:DNA-binding NarL/FixJ family response regulator
MSKSSPETSSPETISATQGITTDITARIRNDPVRNVLTIKGPSCGRAMFMGRQCMAFECMREAISVCGIEADFCSIEDQITKQTWDYDVFVMFLMKYEPGMPALIQQRMNELRACMPRIPTMALLEDANADATTLYQLGFSTIIIGLPSLNFAITAIRLLSLGAKTNPTIDGTASQGAAGRKCPDPDQVNDLGTMLANVSFTKRELDLIEQLRSGMQNKLIAYELGISESTVKAHLRNIMTKLHAKNRTQTIFMLSQNMERRQEAVPA